MITKERMRLEIYRTHICPILRDLLSTTLELRLISEVGGTVCTLPYILLTTSRKASCRNRHYEINNNLQCIMNFQSLSSKPQMILQTYMIYEN